MASHKALLFGVISTFYQVEALRLPKVFETLKPIFQSDWECKHIFLDVGANSGDTVNVFLHATDSQWQAEPKFRTQAEKYGKNQSYWFWDPQDPKTEDFDYRELRQHFSNIVGDSSASLKEWCLVGIEANQDWAPYHKSFVDANKDRVKHLVMHSGLPVTDSNGPVQFECGNVDPENNEWGDSQPDNTGYECTLLGRSLADILQELAAQHPVELVLKMDVENQINKILPPFLQSGELHKLVTTCGTRVIMVVDTSHMSADTYQILKSHEQDTNVIVNHMTVSL